MANENVAPLRKQSVEWQVAGDSAHGASHLRRGLRNQDCIGKWVEDAGTEVYSLVSVSDGHGSPRYFRSHIGSQLAVEAAEAAFREAALNPANAKHAAVWTAGQSQAVAQQLVEIWRTKVAVHLEKQPFAESELAALDTDQDPGAREAVTADPFLAYGATVLAVMATASQVVYLQLGDGDILNVNGDGHTEPALPEDSRLIANRTTSLCQPNAPEEFRSRVISIAAAPALILLATDGYANSFKTYEDFKLIGRDYLRMLREGGVEALVKDLPSILADASASGSGDDVTLGMLVRADGQVHRRSRKSYVPEASPSTTSARTRELQPGDAEAGAERLTLDELQEQVNRLARRVTSLALLLLCVVLGIGILVVKFRPRPSARVGARDAPQQPADQPRATDADGKAENQPPKPPPADGESGAKHKKTPPAK